jgi:arginine/lysine/ornithine decarboxylase
MHNPTGIIKKIEEEASELYGAEKTWLSVNGSSIGIMASICAVTKKGDSILIGRNSHKSVYNAIELNELRPHYIYPEYIGCGINGQVFLTDIVKKIEDDGEVYEENKKA